jgi:transposase
MKKVIYFFGVDVSKETLDLAILKDGHLVLERQFCNKKMTILNFLNELKKTLDLTFDQVLVCMEHTGIYNYPMLEILHKLNIKVCLEPALQIMKSQGMVRGKSDKIDARRIAQYAYRNCKELRIWRPQRSSIQKLKALLILRNRLIKAKLQLGTPLKESLGFLDKKIIHSLKSATTQTLKSLDRDLKRVQMQIDQVVNNDEIIQRQVGIATSVTGIGRVTALYMIVTTNEFRRITNPKCFACYTGVAPFEHSSGSSIRGRTRVSKFANMQMKKLLHLGAMSAIQWSPELRTYYLRKISEGKNKMSVINAVRNKLITRVFACINQNRYYEKKLKLAIA